MRTLALNPTTNDLLITAGALALVDGVSAVRQRLEGRLSLWRGEWVADLEVGVPFLSFLGVKGATALAEGTLRRSITTCPGVASLESFSLVGGADRAATLSFRVRTDVGAFVDVGAFRVGI